MTFFSTPIRLTYLTGYLSPHILPLLNAIGEFPGIRLAVWYCDDRLAFRDWDHSLRPSHIHIISRRTVRQIFNFEYHFDPDVFRFIKAHQADIYCLTQYDIPTLRAARRYLDQRNLPWILHGERPMMSNKGLLGVLAGCILRYRPIKKSAAIVATGQWSAMLYQELAPWGKPVYSVPYYINPDRYEPRPESGLKVLAETCEYSPREADFVFIFVGSLIPRKGLLMLADAFNRVVIQRPECQLLVIGEGPLRRPMEQALSLKARKRTWFLGKVEYTKVPALYRIAHVLVFPTQHDGWGMVVNEAMLSGLPVISTTACGAAHDLIADGKTGYVILPFDEEALADRMLRLAVDPHAARRIGAEARRTILEDHTPEKGAERFYQACREVLIRVQRK